MVLFLLTNTSVYLLELLTYRVSLLDLLLHREVLSAIKLTEHTYGQPLLDGKVQYSTVEYVAVSCITVWFCSFLHILGLPAETSCILLYVSGLSLCVVFLRVAFPRAPTEVDQLRR